MKDKNELKLFIIEFGEPDPPSSGGWYSTRIAKSVYVVAKDYNQAAEKAVLYFTEERQPVVDSDGSLANLTSFESIKSIKLMADNIII